MFGVASTANLVEPTWLRTGFELWKEMTAGLERDEFVLPPSADKEGVRPKEAK